MDRKILWIGGFAWGSSYELTVKKGNNQAAANITQTNLIKGLQSQLKTPITILSAQMFPPYPKYRELFTKTYFWSHCEGAKDTEVGFITAPIINIISKSVQMCCRARKWAKENPGPATVIIYSLHTPYVDAALAAKRTNPELHLCCIVPDLLEYKDFEIDKKPVKKLLKKIDVHFMYKKLLKMDSFIFFTKHMNERINRRNKPYMVMEGLFNADDMPILEPTDSEKKGDKKILMYSGKTDLAFGLAKLVDAFNLLDMPDTELWIFGDGSAREYIKRAAEKNERIKYFGFVSDRNTILKSQMQATLLISMTKPNQEVEKYIFPSKIIEYMASGTAVATFRLAGIDKEYDDFLFYLDDGNAKTLAENLGRILSESSEVLRAKGLAARRFILENKNHIACAKRILKFLDGAENGHK